MFKRKMGERGAIAFGVDDNATVEEVIRNHRRRRHREHLLNNIEDEIDKVRSRNMTDDDIPLWQSMEGKYTEKFSSKKTWMQLRESKQICTWSRGVWFPQATPKFSFMLWIAMCGRMQTGDKMQRWNVGINTECVLCHEVQETCQHLFFSCPYSSCIWENLVKGILNEKFTARWDDIVGLISDASLSSTKLFLVRYSFQAAVHSIWRERNSRRHGEEPKEVGVLSKLIDKTIRLHLLAVKAYGKAYLEKALCVWFGTRLVSEIT